MNNANNTIDVQGSLMRPMAIVTGIIIVIAFVGLAMYLGSGSGTTDATIATASSSWINWLFIGIIVVILCVFLYNGSLSYFFGLHLDGIMHQMFPKATSNGTVPNIKVNVSTNNAIDSSNNVVPEIKIKKQVFNIPGNKYDYSNARAVCKAYGAELATYDQLESAYNRGADWCSAGWTDGQLVLYPTQQKSFDRLQEIKGHEHDCGRPGINGGYNANDKLKFGVNCYGYKPKMTKLEHELMEITPPYPLSKEDIEFQKQVNYWKQNISDILVSPFNKNYW